MSTQPWQDPMPEGQFNLMRDILAAPSPVGLEAAMTMGVIAPEFQKFALPDWKIHTFKGNASIVLDTHPDAGSDMLSVMIVGHADKIRMQVRSVGEDGKIWIDSDSFLPGTLIGHEVTLFSQDPDNLGSYRALNGGTIEALGAIHFADASLRTGDKGIKKEMLYLELQIHGENKKDQIKALGIRPGDPILLKRPIRRGFSPDTFYGAYLDNGLGSFVTVEVARLIAEAGGLSNVRCLFAIASHEEIGRLGSRVLAGLFEPDVLIGVDVSHDYKAAPGIGDRRMTPNAMGKGFTLKYGSIISSQLNAFYDEACSKADIPIQWAGVGRDTGTDAMASVFAAVDSAATSIGFPIRNMHTISETGHTGDVLGSIYATFETLKLMSEKDVTADDFRSGHPRLDQSSALTYVPIESDDS